MRLRCHIFTPSHVKEQEWRKSFYSKVFIDLYPCLELQSAHYISNIAFSHGVQ